MRGRRRLAPPPPRRHCVARCPRRRLRRRAVRGPPAQRPRPPRARPPSPQALAVLTAAARGGRPRLPPQHGAQPRLRQVRLRGRRAPFTVCLWVRAGSNTHRLLRLCSGSDALVLAARKGTACVSVKRTVVATVPLAAGWQLVSLAVTHAVVLAVNGGASADARTPPFVAPGTVAVAVGHTKAPTHTASTSGRSSPSTRCWATPTCRPSRRSAPRPAGTSAPCSPPARTACCTRRPATSRSLVASSARPTTSTSTPSRRRAGSSRSRPRRSSTGTAAAAAPRGCSASSRSQRHPTPSRLARLCLPQPAPLRHAPRGHVRDARLRPHRTAPRAQPAARHARRHQPPPCPRRRLRDPPGPAIPEPALLTTLALDHRLSRALDGGAHVLRVVCIVAASTPPDQAHTVVGLGLVRRVLPLFTRPTRPRSPSTRPPSSSGRSTATARPTSPPRSSSRPSTASLPTAPRSTRTPPPAASSSGPSGRRPRTARTSLPS